MVRRILFLAAAVFCAPSTSAAQPPLQSFADLGTRIVLGDTIYIVETSDRETRGRVTALSDVSLTLRVDDAMQLFDAGRVKRIDRRRRDPILNGVLIGLGAGALVGFQVGRAADSPTCPASGAECGQGAMVGAVGGAVWGALGGWMVDALIRKREAIYIAP